MDNILLHYMKKRVRPASAIKPKKRLQYGPVVTISRDYGCPAKRIAEKLATELNKIEIESFTRNRWNWIGKEILETSAEKLRLKPALVEELIGKDEQGVIDDIVLSLSHRYYPGDAKVKRTIGKVVRSLAEEGHVIIVGRGGEAITQDIPNSLHVKLQAPLEWRINDVSNRQMISMAEAKKKILEIDRQREMLRAFFEGKKVDNSSYDVIFNNLTLDEEDIIPPLIKLMEQRNMI